MEQPGSTFDWIDPIPPSGRARKRADRARARSPELDVHRRSIQQLLRGQFDVISVVAAENAGATLLAMLAPLNGIPRETEHGRAPRARMLAPRLTERERQVALLLAARRTNAEIGDYLGLSVHTIKRYVERVLNKLSVRSRREVGSALRVRTLAVGDRSVRPYLEESGSPILARPAGQSPEPATRSCSPLAPPTGCRFAISDRGTATSGPSPTPPSSGRRFASARPI